MMVYEWGKKSFSIPAQSVGETIERLAARHGGVCPPGALVGEARPMRSKLHGLFTWEDESAADKWRKQEAREVINSLVVLLEDEDNFETRPPAFLHVRLLTAEGVNEGYAPIMDVSEDTEMRQQAISEALAYLRGFQRRYKHLEELAPILDAIEQIAGVPVEV